jgi:hypothetical protein
MKRCFRCRLWFEDCSENVEKAEIRWNAVGADLFSKVDVSATKADGFRLCLYTWFSNDYFTAATVNGTRTNAVITVHIYFVPSRYRKVECVQNRNIYEESHCRPSEKEFKWGAESLAMILLVSYRSLTLEALVPSQVILCVIYDRRSNNGTGFPPSTSVFSLCI